MRPGPIRLFRVRHRQARPPGRRRLRRAPGRAPGLRTAPGRGPRLRTAPDTDRRGSPPAGWAAPSAPGPGRGAGRGGRAEGPRLGARLRHQTGTVLRVHDEGLRCPGPSGGARARAAGEPLPQRIFVHGVVQQGNCVAMPPELQLHLGRDLHAGEEPLLPEEPRPLIPRAKGIPPIRSRRGRRRRKPGELHADEGPGCAHLRRWLRERGVTHRIARNGVEASQRLGRYRRPSNAPWPGSPGAGASTDATNARPATSSP